MRVFKSLIVAALLIGSLLLGMLVASATACAGIRLNATEGEGEHGRAASVARAIVRG